MAKHRERAKDAIILKPATGRVKTVSSRYTQEEYDKYKRHADNCGMTMSMLVELAMRSYFDKLKERAS